MPRNRVATAFRRTETRRLSEKADVVKEGGKLLRRAVRISFRTSNVKVWVPLACSVVLTASYLYTSHRTQASLLDLPKAPAEPAAVSTGVPAAHEVKAAGLQAQPTMGVGNGTDGDEEGGDDSDLRARAARAHTAHEFAQEAKLWEQFMKEAPSPQQACPAIGRAYELSGDIDSSIRAYEQCLSFEPNNADISVAFAHALQTKGDFNRSAALYRQVLQNDPKNVDAQIGLALIQLKENHLREADEAAKKILQKTPPNTDALLIAGVVAWREARLPDAERIFLEGARLDDQRADFHFFLGRIAEGERRFEEALQQYDKAVALDPNDSEAIERRDHLQKAQ